jgi:hypothetical protein
MEGRLLEQLFFERNMIMSRTKNTKNVLTIRSKVLNPKRHLVGYRFSDGLSRNIHETIDLALDGRIANVSRVVDSSAYSRPYILTSKPIRQEKVLRGDKLQALLDG